MKMFRLERARACLGDWGEGFGRGGGARSGEVLDGAALVAGLWLSRLVAVSGGVGW